MTLLWIAIAIAALVLIAGYFVLQRAATGRRYTRQALEQQMEKPAYREVKAPILAADGWVSAHEREDLHVMSYDGKLLHAIYLPKKDAKGTILLFHGYKSCWQIDFGLVLPYYYDTLGYSLLLVDQRAHGSSQGKYLTFGVRERLDVLSWATYMGQKLGQNAPLILGGLSMGATTVLLASCFDFPANVRAVIADCGFTSPYEIGQKASCAGIIPKRRFRFCCRCAAWLPSFLQASGCETARRSTPCARAGTRFCSCTALGTPLCRMI